MPDTPNVSVVVPASASHDITRAIDSVFAQTVSDFEVIVVKQGAPDTSGSLAALLSRFTSRIRYLELPKNRGAGVAWNAGIVAARGRYVAFLDGDNRWYPDFLERQVSYLENHPHCALVCADARIIGESPLGAHRFMERTDSSGVVTLLGLVDRQCTVTLSTVLARRQTIISAGMFDEGLRCGQDFDLWRFVCGRCGSWTGSRSSTQSSGFWKEISPRPNTTSPPRASGRSRCVWRSWR